MKFKSISILGISSFLLFSCVQQQQPTEGVESLIGELKSEYAPDKRIARFEITTENTPEQLILNGQSDQPGAMKRLTDSLEANGIAYNNAVEILPAAELGADTLGIVRVSVANLRSKRAQSAELATQATLGTRVKVLKKEKGWFLVQTPDGYIAWGDDGTIAQVDQAGMDRWSAAPKWVYTEVYGQARKGAEDNSGIVSDLVGGDILEFMGEKNGTVHVRYPDMREGWVDASDGMPLSEWLERPEAAGETLVATAKGLMGLPYLWGGTSTKGVDCSGYTKTIYFLNGWVLPRDASQQVHSGILIDEEGDFSDLIPGDLLFFGRAANDSLPEKVVHVGMWIGNGEFIHSSGDVHISSMDPESDLFDEPNLKRYLRTKRILGNITDDVRQVREVY